jgi:hypothetical protein
MGGTSSGFGRDCTGAGPKQEAPALATTQGKSSSVDELASTGLRSGAVEAGRERTCSRIRRRKASTTMALLLACPALCSSCTGERVLAHVDQPHRVEIIRDKRVVSGGPWPTQHTSCFVRVYLDQICEFAIPCESPAHDLQAYPSQSLVIFRVGAPWHAIRFVGSRAFYDCRPSLGNGNAPDLQHLDSLADAADRILSCEESTDLFEATGRGAPTCGSVDELVSAIRETAGSQSVVALFDHWARTSSYKGDLGNDLWTFSRDDAWSTDFRRNLMGGEKSAVTQGLCPVLSDPTSAPRTTLRAAELCPIDAPGVAEAALTRFKSHLALPAEHPLVGESAEAHLAHMVFSWSAIVAARGFPKEAGQAACALISTDERSRRVDTALAVVAATKTRCPPVLRHLQPAVCPRANECSDASCDSAQVYEALQRWLYDGVAAFQNRVAPQEDYPPESRVGLLVAAARHLGPLPKWVGKRFARRSYGTYESDAPSCKHSQGLRGEPCSCDVTKGLDWFCSLPLDGSYGRLGAYNCEVRVDDAKKLVGFSRRFCLTGDDTGSCIFDADCCLGFACVGSVCR